MAILTTSSLDSAVMTRYTSRYQRAAGVRRLYDQLATGITASQFDLETRRGMGSTYTFNFASDMTPGTTAISETADIVPQVLVDATATITPTSRGEAMKWSQLIDIEAYTDWVAFRAEKIGENAMESIEALAISAALGGNLVSRYAARASLDAGSGSAVCSWLESALWAAAAMVEGLKCPPFISADGRRSYLAIAHGDAFYDLFHAGNVVSAIIYGGLPGTILFNGEVGELAGFKLIISPFAKVFNAAGADHASSMNTGTGYALSSAAVALDKTLAVTTATNVGSGRFLSVGTEETSTTFYPTNERVRYVSGSTTATIIGSGANGGVRFAHPVTDYVKNNDSVYPVAYGAPGSMVKVYATETGPFGEIVGPLEDGLAHQWQSLAWKFFGGYGLVGENYIARGEYASTLDA